VLVTTYLAELGTRDFAVAIWNLRGRISAVEMRSGGALRQIGTASGFELMDVGERVALVCRVELDDDRHDAVKHLLAAGQGHLFVRDYPLIGAVGP